MLPAAAGHSPAYLGAECPDQAAVFSADDMKDQPCDRLHLGRGHGSFMRKTYLTPSWIFQIGGKSWKAG